MVNIKEIAFGSFGRCVEVSNGIIDFVATLDFGPRIIRFGAVGGANMMLEDSEDTVNQNGNKDLFAEKYGEDKGVWHIYGGHRLWTSPEAMPRSYYPENEPVDYEVIENGVRLMPKEQVWTQNKMQIEITMQDNSNIVDVKHTITNTGAWPVEFAVWALTVLSQGGKEVVPMPQRATGLLRNRNLTLWDYTKMNDKRVYWGDKYITLRQDTSADCAFKFGIDSEHGWAAYFNHGDMMVKYFEAKPNGNYPDGGMCFETFTDPTFIEMESLSELKKVEPGDSIVHSEQWQLFKDVAEPSNDEAEIQAVVDKYIKK